MHVLSNSLQSVLQSHAQLVPALYQLTRSVNNEAYLVGGCIRDSLLARPIMDVDLTVAGDGVEVARVLADTLRCPFIPLDETDRTGRVVVGRSLTVDITSFKGNDLIEDLGCRDFTINAMAARLSDMLQGSTTIIDPLNGTSDLKNGILRAPSEQAFLDDPLRILRSYRFSAQLNFTMENNTASWIRHHAPRISTVSGERILDELSILLSQSSTSVWIRDMHESGLIKTLFPVWPSTRKSVSYDLLSSLDQLLSGSDVNLLPKKTGEIREWGERIMAAQRPGRWCWKTVALILDQNMIDLNNQDVILDAVDARLHISKKERRTMARIVNSALLLLETGLEELPDEDLIYKLAYEAEEDIYGVAAILMAYHMNGRFKRSVVQKTVEDLLWIHDRHETIKKSPLPVSGNDIIEMSGQRPGPMVGYLLEKLEKQIILNRITDRAEAIAAIRAWLAESEWTAS